MSSNPSVQKEHHILLVVHESHIRTAFRDALLGAGFDVTVASEGASALGALPDRPPNLILLDLQVPDMPGVELCRQICTDPSYRDVPVVIIADPDDTPSIAEAFDAGATDFVTCRISSQLLSHRIRYMLRASRGIREMQSVEDRIRILKEAIDCLPIGVGISISDTSGKILYANCKQAEMHGYSREELMEMEVGVLAPRKRPLPAEVVAKLGFWERESLNVRKDGERFPVRLSSMAVTNADGECIGIVTACEDITVRKESEKKIHQLAYFDTLTELPNRETLLERLRQALSLARRQGRQIAILFLDLDNFKDVNDTLGHGLGDKLLREVAVRLKQEIRQSDTVARIGGDEFVVVLHLNEGREEAWLAAQRILAIFSKPLTVDGLQLHSSASIGIAVYPDDGFDGETLLKCADAAMYHAKGEGRSIACFFSDEIDRKIRRRVALERHLRESIMKQELYLLYQPQWDLSSGRVVGVEALLRWRNAEFGAIPPSEFIAIAETSGFIFELGKWVFRTACLQVATWKDAGLQNLKMAVNISGKQLHQKDFLESIGRTVEETGVDPGALELEFTESVIMEKADTVIKTLTSLKEMGFLLSIDDFGTGYSSLNYLKHFPIDRIKIDRSFVSDLDCNNDGAAIVEAIISMAHGLRLKVVAEGVENSAQLDFLRLRRCNEIQGYHLAKPMSADAVTALVRETHSVGADRCHIAGMAARPDPLRDMGPASPNGMETVPPAS